MKSWYWLANTCGKLGGLRLSHSRINPGIINSEFCHLTLILSHEQNRVCGVFIFNEVYMISFLWIILCFLRYVYCSFSALFLKVQSWKTYKGPRAGPCLGHCNQGLVTATALLALVFTNGYLHLYCSLEIKCVFNNTSQWLEAMSF